MSEEAPVGGKDGEAVDMGDPIAELAAFEHETSTGLLVRIRRAIQRRTAVAQLTSFSANVPLLVLREFWLILMGQLHPDSVRKENSRGEKTS